MIYLTKDDLITDAFEKLIDESSNDKAGVLDAQEKRAVEYVKSMIAGRYDVNTIFTTPIRNEVLVSIISRITLYNIIRRNAARKVPTDYVEDYNKAIEQLEKISSGRIQLDDLPPAVDENGNPESTSLWGNNSNKDFYI